MNQAPKMSSVSRPVDNVAKLWYKAFHFVKIFAFIDIHLFWHSCVLSLGYKSWLPSQDRSWKKEIYYNTAVVELRIWNISQGKDGVYNLSGLSKLSLVLKRYDLTSWKKTTWPQNINICNIWKMISSSYFHLLNKVGKTWGLCWVGDLAK